MDITLRGFPNPPCKPCEEERIPKGEEKDKKAKPKDQFIPLPHKAHGKKNHGKNPTSPCPVPKNHLPGHEKPLPPLDLFKSMQDSEALLECLKSSPQSQKPNCINYLFDMNLIQPKTR